MSADTVIPARVGAADPGRAETCILFVASVVLLTATFHANPAGLVARTWFISHQVDSESYVIGRLLKTRRDGVFSAAALTGHVLPPPGAMTRIDPDERYGYECRLQYEHWYSGRPFSDYSPYFSQPGGQAFLFGLLDGVLRLRPQRTLGVLRVLTSALSAASLALVVCWFQKEHGTWVGLVVLLSAFMSQWLTVFGRNLWWSIWAFYLPMIGSAWFLHGVRGRPRVPALRHAGLIFALVLVKCLVNAFEYITVTLVMALVPTVYYAVRRSWPRREFCRVALPAAAGGGLAVLAILIVLTFQIAALKGTIGDGVDHIVVSFLKRSHGDPATLPASYAAGLNASTWRVVLAYLTGPYCDFSEVLASALFPARAQALRVRYVHLFAVFLLAGGWLLARAGRMRPDLRRASLALVVATWFSFAAPMSWHIIFKAHSHVHLHMNYLIWQMPWTLFGFALVACALAALRRERPHSFAQQPEAASR